MKGNNDYEKVVGCLFCLFWFHLLLLIYYLVCCHWSSVWNVDIYLSATGLKAALDITELLSS